MATEKVTVLKVIADDAVRTVADLKNNVAAYKQVINEATIGSEEYTAAVAGLAKTQNMLKDAMYLTNTAGQEQGDVMQGLSNAASGVGNSYNALVHQMAVLKAELRNVDTSTAEGAERFDYLAEQIKVVNGELKRMDALQGNFQRNVGNYPQVISLTEQLAKGFSAVGGEIGTTAAQIKATLPLIKSVIAVAKTGITGIKTLLSSLGPGIIITAASAAIAMIKKLIAAEQEGIEAERKRQEAARAEIERTNKARQQEIDKLRELLGIADEKKLSDALAYLEKQGFSIAQFWTQKIDEVVTKFKEGKITAEELATQWQTELYGLPPVMMEALDTILTSQLTAYQKEQEEAKKHADELVKIRATAAKEQETIDKNLAAEQLKILDELERFRRTARENELADLEAAFNAKFELFTGNNEIQLQLEEEYLFKQAEIEARYAQQSISEQSRMAQQSIDLTQWENDEKKKADEEYIKAKQQQTQVQMQMGLQLAGNMSSILGSIADLYEADDANAEKNAKKIKVLRIASATIDTITGAIGAYMACQRIEYGIMGPILGAINAATVVAAGIANIAKIKATKVGSGGDASSGVATPSLTTAAVSAPTYTPEIQQTTIATGASQEQTLNTIAQDQKVYILSSDLEADENARKVQVADTSF